MKALILPALLLLVPTAHATSYFPAGLEEFTTIEGISFQEASVEKKPPSIPKSWKLISVSSGEKSNSNNLWFQDVEGAVYLLQGHSSGSKFFIHDVVYKIPAK